MPDPQSDIDKRYQQVIDDQRNYLLKLQEEFNKHCDQITAEAEKALKELPETEESSRQQVHQKQKQKLDEALSNLRTEIDRSNRQTRKKLEAIHREREELKLRELEQLLESIN